MAFTPLQYDGGRIKKLAVKDAETIAKGDALQFDSGEVKRAASGTTNVRFVALQGVSSASSDEILTVQTHGVEFEADTTNNTNADQVGYSNALTDHEAVNNTNAESGDAFVVTEMVGVATDKKVRGYFLDRVSIANVNA